MNKGINARKPDAKFKYTKKAATKHNETAKLILVENLSLIIPMGIAAKIDVISPNPIKKPISRPESPCSVRKTGINTIMKTVIAVNTKAIEFISICERRAI
jgi:hypothetical protein